MWSTKGTAMLQCLFGVFMAYAFERLKHLYDLRIDLKDLLDHHRPWLSHDQLQTILEMYDATIKKITQLESAH